MSERKTAPRRKRKNKALPLLLLAGVMCVLGVAYLALRSANEKALAKENESTVSDTGIVLTALDSSTVTEIAWRRGEGEWESFSCSNNVWSYGADRNFPLNPNAMTAIASALSSITAVRAIDEGDPAVYGLDNPAYEITVTYNGSTTYRYAVGDKNTYNSAYYFRHDDGNIYMISETLLPYLQYTTADLIQLDTPVTDINSAYITGITVTTADGTANTITDSDGIAGLFSLFKQLDCSAWADYYADSTEMADNYGIDTTAGIAVSYKKSVAITDASGNEQTTLMDASAKIHFGTMLEDGSVYYTPAKSTIVYLMSSDVYTSILEYLTYTPSETEQA